MKSYKKLILADPVFITPGITYVLPGVMKPGRQALVFCNFSQLSLCNISSFTVLFRGDVVFLPFFLVRDLCRSGCRQNSYRA